MKLFTSPTTPFGRKAMVAVHETGLTDRVEAVVVSGTPLAPGSIPIDRNPLGKIPALILDDGRTIYDSRVICRYLDDLAESGLYGSGDALWDVLTLEATADGMLDAAVLMVYENRLRPEELRFTPWVEGQWAKIARALDALEARWTGPLSDRLNMGQIALGCALGYLDFRHDARAWREGHPRLAEWAAGFALRASMQATLPS